MYWYAREGALFREEILNCVFQVAKDIAQESWQVIINKIKGLEDTNKFGSWALSIVNRKSIDWLRKKKRTFDNLKEYYESENTISEGYHQEIDEVQKLKRDIKSLPEGQQMVLQLIYTEEYSLLEICEILKLSKGTVKSRLFYAREKLKTIIKIRNYEK